MEIGNQLPAFRDTDFARLVARTTAHFSWCLFKIRLIQRADRRMARKSRNEKHPS